MPAVMIDQRVRVLHVISMSGPAFYFRALAEHLDRSRFDVRLVTVTPEGVLNREMAERGLETASLNCTSRRDYPVAAVTLARWLRRWRIDVLQTHLFDASLLGLLAGRLAGTPVTIFTGHHSHEMVLTQKRMPLAVDTLCSRWLSRQVVVHCQQMKDDLMRVEGVPADKIAVIPLGFDIPRWRPSPGARDRIRAQLGLQGKVVLGAIGRFFWVKDYGRLIDVFGRLATAHPDVVLLLLGDGPDRAQLERLAAERLPPGRVVFAGEHDDVCDWMSAMDLFVHTALSESFCQVIVEAQLAGLPVISTATGIAPELITSGANGYLIPTGDSEALQRALEQALAARDRWPEMGAEGNRRCQRFSIQSTVDSLQRQYLAWLEQRRTEPVVSGGETRG